MKIVFVAPFGLGEKTTVWARTLPLARQLVTKGCDVTILVPPWDTPGDAGKSWTEGGVRVVNVGLSGGVPLITARLLGLLGTIRPEIIHIVKPRAYAGIVQWLLWHLWQSRYHGPLLVVDVDDWEQAWSTMGNYSPLVARFLDWQENWGITHAHGVTAASRWLERKVSDVATDTPVLYLPNGIDPAKLTGSAPAHRSSEGAPVVLWFSRFVEVEPAWMASFWQRLRQLWPGARLVVGGRALQPKREAAFRQALDVERTAVEWMGYVEPSRLAALYAEVDCAIFPAADVPLNQAKCSVRLATTLLQGMPVVASAVGEQAYYGAHGAAVLVPAAAAPEEFAQAVADLLAAPQMQRQLALQAEQRLRNEYDWARLGEQLYGFYGRLRKTRGETSGQG